VPGQQLHVSPPAAPRWPPPVTITSIYQASKNGDHEPLKRSHAPATIGDHGSVLKIARYPTSPKPVRFPQGRLRFTTHTTAARTPAPANALRAETPSACSGELSC
jgi:hypothetical protein